MFLFDIFLCVNWETTPFKQEYCNKAIHLIFISFSQSEVHCRRFRNTLFVVSEAGTSFWVSCAAPHPGVFLCPTLKFNWLPGKERESMLKEVHVNLKVILKLCLLQTEGGDRRSGWLGDILQTLVGFCSCDQARPILLMNKEKRRWWWMQQGCSRGMLGARLPGCSQVWM